MVVPHKGTTGLFASTRVTDYMSELGCTNSDVVIKSDPENSIKFLLDDVAKARRSARTIIEEAPKQSKGSNGVVEWSVWAVESQLRVMKNALEARIKVGIVASHCIIPWLTEYVGYVINRLEIGKDGKNPI